MIAALDEIRLETPDRNPWIGDRSVRHLRRRLAQLPDTASPRRRWWFLTRLGREELRSGNEKRSIDLLEEAYRLLPVIEGQLREREVNMTIYRLAIAHLRYGETQNCALCHTGQACIMPLEGSALHSDPTGSRNAIPLFLELLERKPADPTMRDKCRWLLNIAYMTLGEHPDGVPSPYLVPPEVFASDQDFPRFPNIAPELAIDTFNLFGGAVADDFDGDGWIDIITTTFDTSGQMRFFRNNGDGTFSDRTEEAGLTGLYGGPNVIQADYDNDGDLDVYVLRGAWLAENGRHPNSLLSNDGHGVFTDVTFESGLGERHFPTQTAAWGDYDNDGHIDLFVGNEHSAGRIDAPCELFHNNGDGTFQEVAEQAGVDNRSFVKGAVFGDYDGDRFPDLYVSTINARNRLYRNNGDGTFSDVAPDLGVDRPIHSFPIWFWDFDNDGQLDLYVPSYLGFTDALGPVVASYLGEDVTAEMPRLYRGDGRGGFVDVAAKVGLDRLHLPMGANFGDLDHDGYLDFYLGTGYPDYEALMPNVMYRNLEGNGFADVTEAGGFGHLQKGHAIAFADFDFDGDQDVFAQIGGVYPGDKFNNAYFQNPGFDHHWLALELVGTTSNRSAIGARIRIEIVEDGRRRSIYRRVNSGGSFGANPLRQTIGVGDAGIVERLEVYWPTSDIRQKFGAIEVDRLYRLIEGKDRLVPLDPRSSDESG
ncbi:MAG: CRTAC1 family protein [Planctomycetota bacterium]|nr:CRTAC1 family protein [Planctomycetota bacterium]